MRILYPAFISFPHQRAHAIHTAKNCEAFVRHGAKVELVVPSARSYLDDDPFAFYGLSERFVIRKIWSPAFLLKTRFGYTVSSFFFGIALFVYLMRRRKHFDVIYSIELEPLGFVGIPFLNKPYFFEMHSPRRRYPQNYLLFSRMNGLVVLNDAIGEEIVKIFPRMSGRIITCPSAVDLSDADVVSKKDARKKLNIPTGKQVAVYTGSFLGWKGLDTVLEAAKKLPEISFYLVGGAKEELGDLPVPPNVTIVGKQPYREMPYWRSAADLLIGSGTKKHWYSYNYTSPMKLLEYMAFKRPIVAAKTRAIECVIDESEAVFYEPDNSDSLKEAVEWIFLHPTEAKKRGERAYIRAEEYSWDSRTKKIFSLINSRL